jgi:Bacterial regulatory proteins, tetR family.
MSEHREPTGRLIADSLKKLMLKTSFEKISIKMITDEAEIRRPTFYNYFQDKYDLLEWIVDEEVLRKSELLIKQGMTDEAIKMLFTCIASDAAFYRKAFEVTGQNGFEEILVGRLQKLFVTAFGRRRPTGSEDLDILTVENIALYYTLALVGSMKAWLFSGRRDSPDALTAAYSFLAERSLRSLSEPLRYTI